MFSERPSRRSCYVARTLKNHGCKQIYCTSSELQASPSSCESDPKSVTTRCGSLFTSSTKMPPLLRHLHQQHTAVSEMLNKMSTSATEYKQQLLCCQTNRSLDVFWTISNYRCQWHCMAVRSTGSTLVTEIDQTGCNVDGSHRMQPAGCTEICRFPRSTNAS